MMQWKREYRKKVAIVTDRSEVLRFATAKEIANKGAKVMLVDIDEKLKKESR